MRPEAQAIDHVLAAERDGETRLEGERQVAQERIDAARTQARRILRRTTERIHRVHAHCAEALQARQKLLEAEAADPDAHGLDPFLDSDQLERAVRALATRLTTAAEEADPGTGPDTHG